MRGMPGKPNQPRPGAKRRKHDLVKRDDHGPGDGDTEGVIVEQGHAQQHRGEQQEFERQPAQHGACEARAFGRERRERPGERHQRCGEQTAP